MWESSDFGRFQRINRRSKYEIVLWKLSKTFDKTTNLLKNPDKPTCIDLILAKDPRMFQSTRVTETGLSDFYLMIMTVMWKTFKKIRSRVIDYRSYADNETFRFSLISNLSN